VYLHAGGAGDPLLLPNDDQGDYLPENALAWHMARRGFVAAILEMPPNEAIRMACGRESNNSLDFNTRQLFAYGGPGDPSENALATICRRTKADCTRGIALHGLSVSGMLARLAPKYTKYVTALLIWSSGTYVPFAHSCCGVKSHDFSCCEREQPVGGTFISCLSSPSTSAYFPLNRQRTIISQSDTMYGDYYCPPNSSLLGVIHSNNSCVYDPTASEAAVYQANLVTGLECGWDSMGADNMSHTVDCIQPDGSGYYIPSVDEVGGQIENYMQGHNFHLRDRDPNSNGPPQHARDPLAEMSVINYEFNDNYLTTDKPWGLVSSFDWLAATAVRPIPK